MSTRESNSGTPTSDETNRHGHATVRPTHGPWVDELARKGRHALDPMSTDARRLVGTSANLGIERALKACGGLCEFEA